MLRGVELCEKLRSALTDLLLLLLLKIGHLYGPLPTFCRLCRFRLALLLLELVVLGVQCIRERALRSRSGCWIGRGLLLALLLTCRLLSRVLLLALLQESVLLLLLLSCFEEPSLLLAFTFTPLDGVLPAVLFLLLEPSRFEALLLLLLQKPGGFETPSLLLRRDLPFTFNPSHGFLLVLLLLEPSRFEALLLLLLQKTSCFEAPPSLLSLMPICLLLLTCELCRSCLCEPHLLQLEVPSCCRLSTELLGRLSLALFLLTYVEHE
jgi:hypothetical protein